ncbi:MAG TPA: homoserine dehydrogenase, partial [Methyloceanibacter sp.]|nr:homoserine dehydrogenase [Methyloceanibacter sp.]
MHNGLKVGLAGVGTVGGGLLQLMAARRDSLAARAGRPIEVVAVSTLEHRRNRDVDISAFRRVEDPVALAKDPEIDVFVELMGGEGGVAKESVEAA